MKIELTNIPEGSQVSFKIIPPDEAELETVTVLGLVLTQDSIYYIPNQEKPKPYKL